MKSYEMTKPRPSALPAVCTQSAVIQVPAAAWSPLAPSALAVGVGVLAGVGGAGVDARAQRPQLEQHRTQLSRISGFAASELLVNEYPTNDPTKAVTKAVKPAGGARGIPPRGRPV